LEGLTQFVYTHAFIRRTPLSPSVVTYERSVPVVSYPPQVYTWGNQLCVP
jgi:hypothetical protein